jgi:hypothetical protein
MSINLAPVIIVYALHLIKMNESILKLNEIAIFSDYAYSEISFNLDQFVSSFFTFTGFEIAKKESKIEKDNGILATIIERNDYFFSKLEILVKDYSEIIIKLKEFRNKYQHNPDKVNLHRLLYADKGKVYNIEIPCKENDSECENQFKSINISLDECINLIKQLNSIFMDYLVEWNKSLTDKDKSRIFESLKYNTLLSSQTYFDFNYRLSNL